MHSLPAENYLNKECSTCQNYLYKQVRSFVPIAMGHRCYQSPKSYKLQRVFEVESNFGTKSDANSLFWRVLQIWSPHLKLHKLSSKGFTKVLQFESRSWKALSFCKVRKSIGKTWRAQLRDGRHVGFCFPLSMRERCVRPTTLKHHISSVRDCYPGSWIKFLLHTYTTFSQGYQWYGGLYLM